MLVEETLVVPATAEALPAVHATLDHFWQALDGAARRSPDRHWRLQFATAVLEITTNIVRHAYPAGTARDAMDLRLRAYADRVVARFADRGIPFTGTLEPRGTFVADPLALPEGGYGLALSRACVDRLAYRRTPQGTNCWRLVKRW